MTYGLYYKLAQETGEKLAKALSTVRILSEALEIYADKGNWNTEAIAYDVETGEFPNTNGVTPTRDIRLELDVPIVWNYSDDGGELAREVLKLVKET